MKFGTSKKPKNIIEVLEILKTVLRYNKFVHFFFAVIFFWNTFVGVTPTVTASFYENNFHLEVADEPYELQRGLMSRPFLAPNRGMIFAYPDERKRSFWMKNTLIPLDVIFLDSQKCVVDMKENFQPCRSESIFSTCEIYTSSKSAKYVVELHAGMVEVMKMRIGDKFFILKGLF